MTIPLTPIMTNIVVRIMVELLSVLAPATKQVTQGWSSKVRRHTNIFRGSICSRRSCWGTARSRLCSSDWVDCLVQDGAQMTVAQTLGIVHGLVGNMN
jgi:hypothetical protein